MVQKRTLLHVLALSASVCLMAGCDESNSGQNQNNTEEICKAGDLKCDATKNSVMECKDNNWTVKIECKGAEKCDAASFTCKDSTPTQKVCDEGQVKCDKSGNIWVSKKCENNAWKDLNTCKEKQTCDDKNGNCVDPTCTTGKKCEGDKLIVCSDAGVETQTDCAEKGKICSETALDCVDRPVDNNCTLEDKTTKLNDGVKKCINGSEYSCSKGKLTINECENGNEICQDGDTSCSKLKDCQIDANTSIETGEFACDSDKNVAQCRNGILKVTEPCGTNYSCQLDGDGYACKKDQAGSCTTPSGETVNNTSNVCVGTVLKKCESGTLTTVKDCATDANASDCKMGSCMGKSCHEGTVLSGMKFCSDDKTKIMLCTNGKETEDKPCGTGEICQPGATPECKSEATVKKYTTIQGIHADYDTISKADTKGCMSGDGYSFMQRADVEVTGIVTAKKSNGFFIQDPTSTDGKFAGIMVHCLTTADNTNCTKTGFTNDISEGDKVKVTASYVGYNKCQLWVRGEKKKADSIKVEKLEKSQEENIQPQPVTISDINEGTHNPYNGTMIKLTEVIIGECQANGSKYCNVKDSSDKQVPVTNYIVNVVNELTKHKGEYTNVTGIGYFDGGLEASALGAKGFHIKECSGTQTKCVDNSLFTCNDGKWPETGTACPTDGLPAHSTASCNDDGNACGFKCESGYKANDAGTACLDDKEPCQVGGSVPDANHGDVVCYDTESLSTCNDGRWSNDEPCSYGCVLGAKKCKPDPVTWCQFSALESDGSMAYVRYKEAGGEFETYAMISCIEKVNSSTPISQWSEIVSAYTDNTSACQGCDAGTVEYTSPDLPTTGGQRDCVAIVYVADKNDSNNYIGVICPNTKVPEASFNVASRLFSSNTTAKAENILSYTGDGSVTEYLLAVWDFNAQNTNTTGGSLKDSAKFEIKSTATLSYKINTGGNDKAVYASGWSSDVDLVNGRYYEVSLSTKGYSNIKLSFESAVSNNQNASLQVAYKTTSSGTFTSIKTVTYKGKYFESFSVELPADASNADSLIIGFFPATSSTSTTVSLDNIKITGER